MNKHYFLVQEIRGWFTDFPYRVIGLTKVHFDFFSPTLISRKTIGVAAALFGVLVFASACEPDLPAKSAEMSSTNMGGPHSPSGKDIYRRHCNTCHGADGTLGLNGAGDLTKSALPLEARIAQIAKGKNLMTAFEGVLSSEEIRAVAAYSETLKK